MSDTSPTLPETSPDPCPSCLAERVGLYCHACGQRYPEGRLTLRGLWRQLPARAFNLERGLLHTFLELFRRPGTVARDYVAGRRSPYINPLTYFLLAATIQLISLTFFQQILHDHMVQQFEPQFEQFKQQIEGDTAAVEQLIGAFGENPGDKVATLYINLMRKIYTYLSLFFMILPFAVYLRVLARRLKPTYNIAEVSIFSIYTIAHVILLTGLLMPITARISINLHSVLSMLTYAVYCGLAARGFYDGRVRPVLLALLAFTGAFLTFMVIFMVIFFAAIGIELSGQM